uniref:Putative reverse transcriptase domain-containing protein n=1 Tax=Tanacetum cinerariifolium TaxID=118510 RepID=A0A6L2KMD0_TANCI|nr:putative reverse transcriptase domain-containing protein [Tanacetum cinerariifolium]
MRSHQNESLAVAGRNLFDDEASSSNNTGAKQPTLPKTLHEHSRPNSFGFQNPITFPTEQTGIINDDTSLWGNNKHKKTEEDGPEWIVRSKFKDELVNFMLEKKSHAKGIGDMLVQHLNYDGKWTEEEEEEDSNKALVVSFYPRTESLEPLEWKTLKNRLKPSSVEPPRLELKELLKQLEYALLQENNQLPVVISSVLSTDEKTRLLEVLQNHKGAITWSIADIKGIDSSFCTHKILMEDEFKPSVQPQRRVNYNIKEVVKKEVIKLLDAGLIYPISDSPWVSPVQVVLKKGGMTVVKNDKDELMPQRTVTGWRMLERLVGHEYYYFLDWFSRYFQIPIVPEDQEKMTFTCPYETFAYKRMPFGLCNAPATFQRCMTAIFHELIEDSIHGMGNKMRSFGYYPMVNRPSEGHHGIATTARKVFKAGFYWLHIFRNAPIDYVSKWVEAQAFPTNDARNVVNFLKKLFARFGLPKALISDRGTNLCNYQMERAMKRYRVIHRFFAAYHPQTNRQVENTNRAIKQILEKTIRSNQKEWSHKLDDALWLFRMAFKSL